MCIYCDWEELLEDIDDMLEGEKYEFAMDTLEGIYEWVLRAEHCTEAQKEAVDNIKESV